MIAGRDWQKSAEDDPEELSILSAVMGVTRDVSLLQLVNTEGPSLMI